MADFAGAFSYLMVNEGTAFVADSSDRGGPTRYGISTPTLTAWRQSKGRPAPTADDVRLLTIAEAQDIYRANYWAKICGDSLSDNGVACMLLDVAANAGTVRSTKLAQVCANEPLVTLRQYGTPLVVDGQFGPKTLTAVNACDRRSFLRCAVGLQLDYLDDIVARDITQRKFLKTWLKRTAIYRDLNW